MTLREARTEGADRLVRANVDSPSLDAALLLSRATGLDKARLLSRPEDAVSAAALTAYRAMLDRRASGDCVAYILGSKEFRGLDFIVTPDVLVPRADTETLVEAALDFIERGTAAERRVLDVCTGSGCVAVAIKAECPAARMSACDLSGAALAVARLNAERLLVGVVGPGGLEKNGSIMFYLGDLLAPVRGDFDLIVSNPPYIPSRTIDTLAPEVRKEPRMALDGGEDGLDIVRRLIPDSFSRLSSGGRLLIEAGGGQASEVARLMGEAGFTGIVFYQDLAGIDRVTGGMKP